MNNRSVPAYYSAPKLPTQDEDPFYDPLFDIPGLDAKEERPGDLFRQADNRSLGDRGVSVESDRPRSGKLSWPFS